jgi:uncharacterized protein (DUF302 family)
MEDFMATTETTSYGITRTVHAGFEETVARVRDLLKAEGFGVLTEIDVRATLKAKIDKDVAAYVILGACNPHLAARALEIEPDLGLLLPCNVTVSSRDGATHVGVVNPAMLVQMSANAELEAVAADAEARLRRVLDAL